MKTAMVIYKGELRTELIHLHSNQLVENDAPTDNHGKGERFSPTDMVAAATASCMLTVMGIKAQSMDKEGLLLGAKAEVKKHMASNPRRIQKIEIEIQFAVGPDEKDRKILEETARRCPVANSLSENLEIDLNFVYPG